MCKRRKHDQLDACDGAEKQRKQKRMMKALVIVAIVAGYAAALHSAPPSSQSGISTVGWLSQYWQNLFGRSSKTAARTPFYPKHPHRRPKVPTPDYSGIMQRLWELDVSGMSTATLRLDLQGNTSTTSKLDMAPEKLFGFVNETFLFSQPTVLAFQALVDNYNPEVGQPETETPTETAEIAAFLTAICDTAVMREVQKFLNESGKPYPTMDSLKEYLKEVWFSPYPRSRNWTHPIDSSGFEHVFLGESKRKQKAIGGLHNWIQAYLLEKNGQLDYTGYIKSYAELQPGRFVFGARLRAYNNYWKSPFSSFIFGSSPEFDIAAYTICHVMRPNKRCSFSVHNQQLSIMVYRFQATNFVETAYPDISY